MDDTWHDQKPSHSVRPSWLNEAQEGAASAWQAYSEEIDRQNDALDWDRDKLIAIRKAASDAEQWYLDCCAFWHRGEIPPSVKVAMELGPQEPPQDHRIFNRRQPDGSYRPLSEFWGSAEAAMEAEQNIPFDRASDRIPDCVREDLGIIFKAAQ